MSRKGGDRIGEGLHKMLSWPAWVCGTLARPPEGYRARWPPMADLPWRSGRLLGLPTASGAATMGHSKTAPGQQCKNIGGKGTQPVQAIETPRIAERYPPIGVGESVPGDGRDETRRDGTKRGIQDVGVFGQTGCVRRRPGRIDRKGTEKHWAGQETRGRGKVLSV